MPVCWLVAGFTGRVPGHFFLPSWSLRLIFLGRVLVVWIGAKSQSNLSGLCSGRGHQNPPSSVLSEVGRFVLRPLLFAIGYNAKSAVDA